MYDNTNSWNGKTNGWIGWEIKNEIQHCSFGEVKLEYLLVILCKFSMYTCIWEICSEGYEQT